MGHRPRPSADPMRSTTRPAQGHSTSPLNRLFAPPAKAVPTVVVGELRDCGVALGPLKFRLADAAPICVARHGCTHFASLSPSLRTPHTAHEIYCYKSYRAATGPRVKK